jgi:hypothetical protein
MDSLLDVTCALLAWQRHCNDGMCWSPGFRGALLHTPYMRDALHFIRVSLGQLANTRDTHQEVG